MKIIIGADIVATDNNRQLFIDGNVKTLVGKEIITILDQADFRIFNLEMALTDDAKPIKKCGPNISAPTACINGIKALNTDLLCISNNHVLDFGYDGLFSTIQTIDNASINRIGAGFSKEEAEKSYIFEKNGKKIGVYNCCEHEFSWVEDYGFGCNGFDALETPDKIKALKDRCDYVIVLYHGGKEHYRYPSPRLKKICRKLVEKGADLVLCQHTHCVGCEEDFMHGKIIYGQGNFIFVKNYKGLPSWYEGFLLSINITEKINYEYIPFTMTDVGVRLDNSGNIIKEYKERSEQIKVQGFIDKSFNDMAENTVMDRYVNAIVGKGLIDEQLNEASMLLFHYAECEVHHECLLTGLRKKLKLGKFGEFKNIKGEKRYDKE